MYYKRMHFGLKNARATFQWLMNKMFSRMLGKSTEVYIHDVLIKSFDAKAHVGHYKECFIVLQKNRMKLKENVCSKSLWGSSWDF